MDNLVCGQPCSLSNSQRVGMMKQIMIQEENENVEVLMFHGIFYIIIQAFLEALVTWYYFLYQSEKTFL